MKKTLKKFRKNHVFEANIITQAENFRNLFTWPERTFTCGAFFEVLNCLGEIGLEKNSRNFYKCRGMSRFGEKKLNANKKAPRFARRLKNKTDVQPLRTKIPPFCNCSSKQAGNCSSRRHI